MNIVQRLSGPDFFRRRPQVSLGNDFAQEAQTEVVRGHIERNRIALSKVLDRYSATEARLVDEIAARTEELRQVRVSIAAMSQADAMLEQGETKIAAE